MTSEPEVVVGGKADAGPFIDDTLRRTDRFHAATSPPLVRVFKSLQSCSQSPMERVVVHNVDGIFLHAGIGHLSVLFIDMQLPAVIPNADVGG